jgi:hypothetical protein
LPSPVAAIVRRLMMKQPDDRFQTPMELAAALAPFAIPGLAGAQPSGQPPLADADGLTAATAELNVAPEARGAGGALDGTLPPDLMPTPLSAESLPILVTPIRRPADPGRRWTILVFSAVVVIAGLVGVVGALLLAR